MRWMIERLCRDAHGGISVLVALLLVVLLGAAAIAVDAGVMYAERAELQNGADAAALAIAQECADGTCLSTTATAELYANRNAKDNASNVADVQLTSSSVTVDVASRDGDTGAGSLSLFFAPVLGIDETTVRATATAGWNMFPHSGPAILPLAFAPCVFKLDGGVQLIRYHGNTDPPSCTSTSPSGQILPGGFSWLAGSGSDCKLNVENNTDVPSKPGVSPPSGCDSVLNSLYGKTALLPVYDDFNPAGGANGSYHIKGWAAFKILGWKISGSEEKDNNTYAGAKCTGNCRGLIGEFVTFSSLGDGFTGTTDSDADLGASIVTLTK